MKGEDKVMSKLDSYLRGILSALFFTAVALFFGLAYPHHLHFQEQYQLFEWTLPYFRSVVAVPGGFADWCGRFLTQFFLSSWAGAFLMSSLLVAMQLLCWKLMRRKSLFSYVLSFLPALVLFIATLDYTMMPGAAVALDLALCLALPVVGMPASGVRTALSLAGIPVVYMLCGPVAVIYALICATGEKISVLPVSLLICAACPLVSRLIFHFSVPQLLTGVHYCRSEGPCIIIFWISAAVALILPVVSLLIRDRFKSVADYPASAVLFTIIAIAAFSGVKRNADFSHEEVMRYDWLCRQEKWDEIIENQRTKPSDKVLAGCCLNLALCKKGVMSEQMFNYGQHGVQGLFPEFKIVYTLPIQVAEVFWNLGMVSACQNYIFEAQEAIPDFQKSARCYVRLAETNMVDGRYEVARRYLNSLSNTLFYGKWAKKMAAMLSDEAAVAADETIAGMRALRLKHDIIFDEGRIDEILRAHIEETPENRAAYEYLLAYDLLEMDLDAFKRDFDPGRFPVVPKHYQEAVLMSMVDDGLKLEEAPAYVAPAMVERMLSFIKDVKAGKSKSFMHKKYGDTYWLYCTDD